MGRPKKDKKSGAKGSEGSAEAWDTATAEANGRANKTQNHLPLNADEEQVRTERELPTPLSETEHAFTSAKVVETTVRIEELEAEIAEFTKPRRKEIAQLEKERTKLTREAHTRARWGLVACRERHLFRNRTVEVYRLDRGDPEVGELIETRAMTAEELEKATFEVRTDERIELPAGAEVH